MAVEFLTQNELFKPSSATIDAAKVMAPKQQDPSKWDTLSAAFQKENSLVSAITNEYISPEDFMVYDESHDPFETIVGTKYEPYINNFINSRNANDTTRIMGNIDREIENRKTLQSAGHWADVFELGAGIADPIGWFVGGAAGKSVGRLGTNLVIKAGGKSYPVVSSIIGAAADVAVTESVLQATQETRTVMESVAGVIGGAAIGGAIGSVLGRTANKSGPEYGRTADIDASLDDAMFNMSGQTKIPDGVDRAKVERDIEHYAQTNQVPGYTPHSVKLNDIDVESFKSTYKGHIDDGELTYHKYDNEWFGMSAKYDTPTNVVAGAAAKAATKATIALSSGGRTSTSYNPVVRSVILGLSENTRMTSDNTNLKLKGHAAETYIDARRNLLINDTVKSLKVGNKTFKKTLDDFNASNPDNQMKVDDFNDSVTRYLREGDTEIQGAPVNPAVKEVADNLRRVINDVVSTYDNLGVADAGKVGEYALGDLSFLNRTYSDIAIRENPAEFKSVVKDSVEMEMTTAKKYAADQNAKFKEELPTDAMELIDYVMGKAYEPKSVIPVNKDYDVSEINFGQETKFKDASDDLDDLMADLEGYQKAPDTEIKFEAPKTIKEDDVDLDDLMAGVMTHDEQVAYKASEEYKTKLQDWANDQETPVRIMSDDGKRVFVETETTPTAGARDSDISTIRRNFGLLQAQARDGRSLFPDVDLDRLNVMYDKIASLVDEMRMKEITDNPRYKKPLNTPAYQKIVMPKDKFNELGAIAKANNIIRMVRKLKSTSGAYADKAISTKQLDGLTEYMTASASGVGISVRKPSESINIEDSLTDAIYERVISAPSESMKKFLDNNPESILRRLIDKAVPLQEVMKLERELLRIKPGKMVNEAGEKLTGDLTYVFDKVAKQHNDTVNTLKLSRIASDLNIDVRVGRSIKQTKEFKRGGFNMKNVGSQIQKEFKEGFLDELVSKKFLKESNGTYTLNRNAKAFDAADTKRFAEIKAEVEKLQSGQVSEIDVIEGVVPNVSDPLSQANILNETWNKFISEKIVSTSKKNGYDFETKTFDWRKSYDEDYLRDKADLEVQLARVKGDYRGSEADRNSAILTGSRNVRKYNAASYLGKVLLSSVPDVSRLVATNGIGPASRGTIATIVSKIVRGVSGGNALGSDIQRLGYAAEVAMNRNSSAMLDAREGINTSKITKGINWMADTAMYLTGLKHWNDFMKTIDGVTFMDNTMKNALTVAAGGKVKKADLRRLAEMGLDKDDLAAIAVEYNKHGSSDMGVRIANIDMWDDKILAARVHASLTKHGNSTIITPGAFDAPNWTDSNEYGKSISQFTSFHFASVQRGLVQGLSSTKLDLRNGDIDVRWASSIPIALVLSGIVTEVRNQLAGRETDWDSPETWFRVVDGSGTIPHMGMVSRPFKSIGWDLEGGTTSHVGAKAAVGAVSPSLSTMFTGAAATKDLMSWGFGDGGDDALINAAHEMSRATPFQSNLGLSIMTSMFAGAETPRKEIIEDIYNDVFN